MNCMYINRYIYMYNYMGYIVSETMWEVSVFFAF